MTGYNPTPICEKLWHDRGYLCMVVLTPMGHRCGYVGIHKGQPYYGNAYHKLDWIGCHGGLTYSESYHPSYKGDVETTIWWIGFDCAHCYDIPDVKAAESAWGEGSEPAKRADRMASFSFGDCAQVRSLQFCEEECTKIVDQLVNGRTKDNA